MISEETKKILDIYMKKNGASLYDAIFAQSLDFIKRSVSEWEDSKTLESIAEMYVAARERNRVDICDWIDINFNIHYSDYQEKKLGCGGITGLSLVQVSRSIWATYK